MLRFHVIFAQNRVWHSVLSPEDYPDNSLRAEDIKKIDWRVRQKNKTAQSVFHNIQMY